MGKWASNVFIFSVMACRSIDGRTCGWTLTQLRVIKPTRSLLFPKSHRLGMPLRCWRCKVRTHQTVWRCCSQVSKHTNVTEEHCEKPVVRTKSQYAGAIFSGVSDGESDLIVRSDQTVVRGDFRCVIVQLPGLVGQVKCLNGRGDLLVLEPPIHITTETTSWTLFGTVEVSINGELCSLV